MPAGPPALRAVLSRVDGEALVTHAARHGLSAVLADALAAQQVEGVLAPEARARLQVDARTQIARALKLKRLTLEVVDALHSSGVTPTLLKGYGLARRLYPEQPLARPSTDVDVLVSEAELGAAREAMMALGLRAQVDDSLGDVFEEHHHLSFGAPGKLVEVHFRLFSGFGGRVFEDAAVRRRFVESSCEGRRVWQLSAEDEFLYLATHAANHSFLRISWLVDLQRYLLHAPALNWADMGRDARTAGFASAVAATLWLLESALGVALPPAAVAAFRLGRFRRAGHARAFAAGRVESAEWSAHRIWGFALRLWLVDSPRAGLRHTFDGARRFARHWLARD